jgi:hypothetical protein
MTDHSGIVDDLDAEPARRVDAERRVATVLVELERQPGHVLLSRLLWSRPCDLAATTRALVDCRRMLQRAYRGGQGRPV